ETVRKVTLARATALDQESATLLLTELEVDTGDGSYCFQQPLGVLPEEQDASAIQHQLALARVRQGRRVGFLTDAVTLPSFAHSVLRLLRADGTVPATAGELRFEPTRRLQDIELPDTPEVRILAAEQSNSSLVIGERIILKLIRRVAAGVHPEAEMGRYLTERGFANIAALLGEVSRLGADGEPRVLMVLQEFLHNQGDAWSWTQNMLQRAIADATVPIEGAEPQQSADALNDFAQFAGVLGKRVGEMHAVLAEPGENPAFAPERASPSDCAQWAAATQAQIDHAFDLLARQQQWAQDADRLLAQDLIGRRGMLHQRAGRLAGLGLGSPRIRIHGDLHLGQILVAQEDAYIIDFEGEPSRPLQERRGKSSPFRDVAGMLRSFDYAAATARHDQDDETTESRARKRQVVERFSAVSRAAFLEQYRAAAGRACLPEHEPAAAALIELFSLQKAAYEVAYEIANRPAWLGIPLLGLARAAEHLVGDEQDRG
ncbi:MAG: putative maltokinase, partial [Nevskia sp.]|nr:putative maltokinase [Nevskia sp.]